MRIRPEDYSHLEYLNRETSKADSVDSVGDSPSYSLQDSPATPPSQPITTTRTTQERLTDTVRVLRMAYDFAFDQIELPEEQKSQAQHNDESRYEALKDRINSFITQHDDQILQQGINLDKYLAFERYLSKSGNKLSSANINKLKETLGDQSIEISDPSIIGQATNKALQARRAAAGFAAGFFLKPKDIAQLEKLPKEKKEKIKLIQQCIALEEDRTISPENKRIQYAKLNKDFRELTDKELRRDRRNILKILARQANRGQLLSSETVSQIASSAAHPITKVATDKDLSIPEKTIGITKKLAKATAKAGTYLASKGVESAQFLTKHTVKQPLMASYRLPMSIVNGLEYLTLQGQALAEEDPGRKAKIQQEADEKYKSLGYTGEKFIRAVAATAGIALIDTAVISSAGVSIPVATGAHLAGSGSILIAAEVMDQLQNAKDGLEMIEDKVEKVNKHREHLHKVIKARRVNTLNPRLVNNFRESLREEKPVTEQDRMKKEQESMAMEDVRSSTSTIIQSTTTHIDSTTSKVTTIHTDSTTSEVTSTNTVTASTLRQTFASKQSTSYSWIRTSSKKVHPIQL